VAPIEVVGPGSLHKELPPDRERPPGGIRAMAARPVTVIQRLAELDGLAEAWDALAERSGLPMQDYGWARAAAASFAAEGRLHIVAVGVPPAITAVAPLAWSRSDDGGLEMIGVNELGEPMDFLYATPSALAALTDALARVRGYLALNRMPAASSALAALRRSYRGRGKVFCHQVGGWPWIPLDAQWTDPERQLNPGRRSDLRRARRLAEKQGPISAEVVLPTPETLEPLLDEAFRVEAASWKGSEGTALVSDPTRELFYRRYADAACKQGNLLVCLLRIGQQVAAMQIAVTSGGRFWLLKIGYDHAFSRCSPGVLLMLETIRYAVARGLHSYEFLGSEEPWTKMWTSHVRPCVSVRAYPASLPGMSALAAEVGRLARRRLARLFRRAP